MSDHDNYLMIQNPGQAPIEGFMVLGVSTSRENTDAIGQFGSGSKQAAGLLLRNKINPVVFCGGLKLTFFVEPKSINDGHVTKNYGLVNCRVSGKDEGGKQVNRKENLNFSLEYGSYDWNKVAMALREYVANALDRTIKEYKADDGYDLYHECSPEQIGQYIQKALKKGDLSVSIVGANQVRAKKGFTRVFVPLTEDVNQFYAELGKRFLHFSEPENLGETILAKRDRNLSTNCRVAVIYKHGVLVREIESSSDPSLFDYNFGNELELDESRTVDDWKVKSCATKALRAASKTFLIQVVAAELRGETLFWEGSFDSYYLSADNVYNAEEKERIQKNWREAFDEAVGQDTVVAHTDDKELIEYAESKGHKVKKVKSRNIANAAEKNDVRTLKKTLSAPEGEGKEILPASTAALEAVATVWDWCVKHNQTRGKEKPETKCFRSFMNAEADMLGFWVPGEDNVYIREDISSNGVNKALLAVALEEVGHYITESKDLSRDFQTFFIRMIVEVLAGNLPDGSPKGDFVGTTTIS